MKEELTMQAQQATSYLANAAYIESLYEIYLKDPQAVDIKWHDYFAKLDGNNVISLADVRAYFEELARQPIAYSVAASDAAYEQKHLQVFRLIDAYRRYGHYLATLDPLNLAKKRDIKQLSLAFYGLENDVNTSFNLNGILGIQTASLKIIEQALQHIYCSALGIEYMHLVDEEQISWLQQRIESAQTRPSLSPAEKLAILQRLTEAEGLERYLGAKYVGQTRFSLEGGDSLMPMVDAIVKRAVSHQVKELVIGMGHRGRLNILINTLGKAPADLFQEFEGKHNGQTGSGDVKYHMGFSCDVHTQQGNIHLALAFNPSHLEIVDPVVEGSVRSRQDRRQDLERTEVVPLLLHGDAAFAGQGVVMETLNLSATRGYSTGGTVHVVVNNQIGFTTSAPEDARSTWYCTDVAKMVEAPIFHVNGDDAEAAVFAAQLAFDFRMQFKKDVVIDLVCYRRQGHNEGDEPSATQPVMYQHIKQQVTPRKIYADKLIKEAIITADAADAAITDYRDKLDQGREITPVTNGVDHDQYATDWKPYRNQHWTASAKTSVSLGELQALAKTIEVIPAGFVLQAQVGKMYDDRRKMTAGELPLNWGYAETLAYATLLREGYLIRISGQDCGRGTFAHRHAVLHCNKNDKIYIPLQHISEKQAPFTIFDSVLSEEAVLGFEYGYASADPKALVIWEAQYGDFVNGAQVVIDQFISSGEQKWERLCGLVMLLPHGYEGAGPEHSSARPERFLQLCAQENMQVCMPTTPAQIFHLLRRQMLRSYRKPLIVMTPKSMLRHKLAVSTLQDLAEGQFQVVIPEMDTMPAEHVRKIILCSGKVYYDLLEKRRANQQNDIAIIRVEQLYPFPDKQLADTLKSYKKAKEIVWCQEEPKNQGAWYSIVEHLMACLSKSQTLSYIGRPASAAPATGIKSVHVAEQKVLIDEALK